jgi:predicted site-specific integrase-resolvase
VKQPAIERVMERSHRDVGVAVCARVSTRDKEQDSNTQLLPLGSGALSRRKAALELGIGYATLERLLDTQNGAAGRGAGK